MSGIPLDRRDSRPSPIVIITHGIIVTYDITDRESFSKVSEWMSEVDKHAQENISRILVGNKKDLEDQR